MQRLLEMVLADCDADIREVMLARSTIRIVATKEQPKPDELYFNWQLLHDPVRTILEWQTLRNMQKQTYPIKFISA